jgi:uncharacterized protein
MSGANASPAGRSHQAMSGANASPAGRSHRVTMLKIRVIPNAKKTEFAGHREGELLLRLNAPPVDGKANKAAIDFVARYLGVSRSSVQLTGGERSRHKIFEIVGLGASDLERKLAETDR